MILSAAKLRGICPQFRCLINAFSSMFLTSSSSLQAIEDNLKTAVQTKNYQQIPHILNSSKEHCKNASIFSFMSSFDYSKRTEIIDGILQSFICIRPRHTLQMAYSCLLTYILQSPNPFPIALAIIQRTLRSGCVPIPQTNVFLSSAWSQQRSQINEPNSVAGIFLGMKSIGYTPDCGTCNYVLSSLCAVDQVDEAVRVLRGMSGASCIPDLDSYGIIIGAMCKARKCDGATQMLKKMIVKVGITPRDSTVIKVVAALRANRETRKMVDTIDFLERENYPLGFESYEMVAEGCLERKEYVLAGKVVMKMTSKGFVPYIKVRQKMVEGLAAVGELDLLCAVRQRFVEMRS